MEAKKTHNLPSAKLPKKVAGVWLVVSELENKGVDSSVGLSVSKPGGQMAGEVLCSSSSRGRMQI